MATKRKTICPDFIFESSWEVCNKVGGIYTVLSTRAKTLQQEMQDKLIFIGPDFWKDKKNPLFKEEKQLPVVGTSPAVPVSFWWILIRFMPRKIKYIPMRGMIFRWIP